MLGAFAAYAKADAAGEPPAAKGIEDKAVVAALVEKAVERLQEVVEQETTALRSRQPVNLKDFNDRKSQGLLELTRAMRRLDGPPDQPLLARLARLRAGLETNRAVLAMHLEAVREISTIMVDAMRDAESDGTYAPSVRNPADRYADKP